MSASIHALIIAALALQPVPVESPVAEPVLHSGPEVAIAPVPMPEFQPRPEPEPERPPVEAPRDATPLGPDSRRPDAAVPQEAGPVEPEPEINPPAAPEPPRPQEAPPAEERRAARIPTAFDYSAYAMSRLRPPTSAFGGEEREGSDAKPTPAGERVVTPGANGQVGISSTPDTRDWRPSFPEAAGRCVEVPDLGRNEDGSPILASVLGRVYEADGRTPLIGAHLQIVGTSFVSFSNKSGDYTLQFDPKLLERCRVQYVRVSAEGYDGRMLTLSIGRKIRSDDVLLRRR
ncbi:MAG: hypothetical protein H0W15_11585 [Gemmatimonadales bacterium]|nr:hypothetical protein [Gemmatimonadales bacterium]